MANINTNANFQSYQQGTQIGWGSAFLYLLMSSNVASKLSEKMYHEYNSGLQVYLERPVAVSAGTAPTYDGEGGNNILTRQESYKATITQYSFASTIANETVKTMDSKSASMSFKYVEDQIKQSASNGSETILLQRLANGVTVGSRGTGGTLTNETTVGALTQTDVFTSAMVLEDNNVVKYAESLKPSKNISTQGVNPAYALIMPSKLIGTINSFADYLTPAQYGNGQGDVIDFAEKGAIPTAPSVRIFSSTLTNYTTPDEEGAYMCFVFGKQAFSTVLMNTSAQNTQKGVEDVSPEESLQYRMGMLVSVQRETYNTPDRSDPFLTKGMMFTAQLYYAHLVFGSKPIVSIRAKVASST